MVDHTTLSRALTDLFDPATDPVVAVERHYAPDYRHRIDGTWVGRAEFLDQVQALRTTIRGVRVSVLDELRTGDSYAERHVVELTAAGGSTSRTEVFVFGSYAPDGRFRTLHEATAALPAGTDADELR